MKYLKSFNESREQLTDSDKAREVISKVYDIIDEIPFDLNIDFLVDINQFIDYANKHDGSIAGNIFNSLDEFKRVLQDEIEGLNLSIGDSPIIYVSPFWESRFPEDILEFGDVYTDTVYIRLDNSIVDKMKNDDRYNQSIWSDIQILESRIKADETDILKSTNGDYYLRIWWD